MKRRATQKRTAEVVGIALTTYRRLERGEIRHPPLAWLRNLALALEVELDDILEPEWGAGWTELDARAKGPPPKDWHRPVNGKGRE
jgi:transcriptional regulator with XRE-family HTH domain